MLLTMLKGFPVFGIPSQLPPPPTPSNAKEPVHRCYQQTISGCGNTKRSHTYPAFDFFRQLLRLNYLVKDYLIHIFFVKFTKYTLKTFPLSEQSHPKFMKK